MADLWSCLRDPIAASAPPAPESADARAAAADLARGPAGRRRDRAFSGSV